MTVLQQHSLTGTVSTIGRSAVSSRTTVLLLNMALRNSRSRDNDRGSAKAATKGTSQSPELMTNRILP